MAFDCERFNGRKRRAARKREPSLKLVVRSPLGPKHPQLTSNPTAEGSTRGKKRDFSGSKGVSGAATEASRLRQGHSTAAGARDLPARYGTTLRRDACPLVSKQTGARAMPGVERALTDPRFHVGWATYSLKS